jgi:NAD(P)-dependent dehydrogenase (short-subunit alcohol dehydrogenase family)
LKSNALFNELFDLTGKVALVTGGSKGLGRIAVETLARAGANVAFCSRHQEKAETVAKEIAEQTGQTVLGLKADVSLHSDVKQMIEQTQTALGTVDILITSAGINIRKDATLLSESEWDQILDINLKGSFLTAKAVISGMRKKKWGRIIFLGSALSHIAIPGRTAYASSKAGILGLTRALALENADYGICVNAICPGAFKTPMNRPVLEDENKSRAITRMIPMNRWGNPAELRGIILYLSSSASSYTTGSSIVIDGGWLSQ